MLGEYTRTSIRSDILYIQPQNLQPDRSLYREFGHSASGSLMADLTAVRVEAGGSMYISTGSRPTDYYVPVGRAAVPLGGFLEANGEWRWYAFSQELYRIESFRIHQFIAGLRFFWR